MSPTVRTLTFADLDPRSAYAAWRLRQDVFVVEQECAYPDLDGRDDEPGTRHVVLTDASDASDGTAGPHGPLLGYARVLEEGEERRIGRVALTRVARGQGLADLLMRAALDACGRRRVVLSAQSPLATWYAGFGFEVTGPEFLEDGIAHLPMTRDAEFPEHATPPAAEQPDAGG